MIYLFSGNPAADVIEFLRWIWYYAWWMPWNIQFFFFPFTFGHLLYGFIIVDVICHVIYKMNQKGEYNGHKHGFWDSSKN